ncbi:MAG: hypothetical protein ABFD03_06350 [Clostridiaceae bacterium]|nr:hypothetical protein [Feifaniaceae bacterium]
MTNVLGFPLDTAKELLALEGCLVETREARSKKGVFDGSERRVIQQSARGENEVLLVYAIFKTEPDETTN